MALIGSIFELAGISLVFPLIAIMAKPEIIQEKEYLSYVYNFLEMESQKQFLITISLAMVGVFIIKNFYMMWFHWVRVSILSDWRHNVSVRLMTGYLHSPYTSHLKRHSSEFIRNFIETITQVFWAFLPGYITLFVNAVTALAILTMLLIMQPVIIICSSFFIGGLFVLYNRFFNRRMEIYGKEAVEISGIFQKVLQQSLGAIKETMVLCREKFFVDEFSKINMRLMINRKKSNFTTSLPPLVTEIIMMTTVLFALTVIMATIENPQEALAGLGVIAASISRLVPLFNRSVAALASISHSKFAVDVLCKDLVDFKCTVDDFEKREKEKTTKKTPFSDSIKLNNISFSYPNSDNASVKDVSIDVKKGEFVGLVGISGAGKTTLADILLGLLEPDSGQFLIDGKDISSSKEGWQLNLGYVPQDIFIVDDSLKNNVAFGIAKEDIDEGKVWHALKLASMDKFVKELPEGLETRLHEKGVRFSGGQKQRIGIARALYHDPEVLIFDEATSALDVSIEKEITKSIYDLRGTKTVIVIAHRLSTLKGCDRLIFLKNGEFIDAGSFSELSERNPDFKKMLELSNITL